MTAYVAIMHTVVIDSLRIFHLEQRPEPIAGPGAVVVRVRAAGLNAADAYARLAGPGKFGKVILLP